MKWYGYFNHSSPSVVSGCRKVSKNCCNIKLNKHINGCKVILVDFAATWLGKVNWLSMSLTTDWFTSIGFWLKLTSFRTELQPNHMAISHNCTWWSGKRILHKIQVRIRWHPRSRSSHQKAKLAHSVDGTPMYNTQGWVLTKIYHHLF